MPMPDVSRPIGLRTPHKVKSGTGPVAVLMLVIIAIRCRCAGDLRLPSKDLTTDAHPKIKVSSIEQTQTLLEPTTWSLGCSPQIPSYHLPQTGNLTNAKPYHITLCLFNIAS